MNKIISKKMCEKICLGTKPKNHLIFEVLPKKKILSSGNLPQRKPIKNKGYVRPSIQGSVQLN